MNKLNRNNNDNLIHVCNCKKQNECPLGIKCNYDNKANISTKENDTNDKVYIGMTSLNWKFRYNNHLKKSNIKKIKLLYLDITEI